MSSRYDDGPAFTAQDMEELRAEANRRRAARQARSIIWDEIQSERYKQDEEWGGAVHDDQHSSHDWIAYIVQHSGKAVMWPFDLATFRRQMVRTAALAVAAIEWADRLSAAVDTAEGQGE